MHKKNKSRNVFTFDEENIYTQQSSYESKNSSSIQEIEGAIEEQKVNIMDDYLRLILHRVKSEADLSEVEYGKLIMMIECGKLVGVCELLEESTSDSLYDLLIIPMDTNKESLLLASKLRNNGIKVIIEMNKRKVKKALESANKNSIPYVIILGQNEIDTNTIELKDMNNSKSIKINLDNTNEIVDIMKNKH